MYIIPLRPRPKGRPRFHGHAYTDKKTQEYERAIKDFILLQNPERLDGAISLNVIFMYSTPRNGSHYKTNRPDIDNLLKGLLDPLNGILWADDSQVVEVHASKVYGRADAIYLEVKNVSE